MDCKAARSEVEKAICSSSAARAADDAMVAAYKKAHAASAGDQRAMLLAAQRLWIERRGASCDMQQPGLGECLARETDARRAFLESRAETGPGAGPMEPVLVVTPARKGAYQVTVELTRFAAPATAGQKALNAEVARMIRDVPRKSADLDKDVKYAHDVAMRVTYASPRLVSARFDGYDFEGGAHGNPWSSAVNIDMATGRKLGFADAFDKQAREKLDAECLVQVLRQKKERGAAEPVGADLKDIRKNLDEGLGDLGSWNFSASAATIVFGPYNLGPYAEGSYSCEFPVAHLKTLAARNFPLPE